MSTDTPRTPSSVDLKYKSSHQLAKSMKNFLTKKDVLQMNQRNFMMLLFIIGMVGYIIYRYMNQFFSRKSTVDELVNQYHTEQNAERNRINTLIHTEQNAERNHIEALIQLERTARTLDNGRLIEHNRELETNIQELREMFNDEDHVNAAPANEPVHILDPIS